MQSVTELGQPEYLDVGAGASTRRIAYRYRAPAAHSISAGAEPPSGDQTIIDDQANPPIMMWLGGFKSDMDGSKALAIGAFASSAGLGFLRFDYSGHGLSGGAFLDGTISRWLDEADAVLAHMLRPEQPVLLVGSSMGAWITLLLNERLKVRAWPCAGLVLIAPAHDMTHDLMWANFTEAQRAEMAATGRLEKPSDYSDEPYILTRDLIEDGRSHLFGNRIVDAGCPVHILQGGQDQDVPPAHALKLLAQMPLDRVNYTSVPDGDHRLSRDQDLAVLLRILKEMMRQS